jgi:hypothetical protein
LVAGQALETDAMAVGLDQARFQASQLIGVVGECGRLGMVTWLTNYLDPQFAVLSLYLVSATTIGLLPSAITRALDCNHLHRRTGELLIALTVERFGRAPRRRRPVAPPQERGTSQARLSQERSETRGADP